MGHVACVGNKRNAYRVVVGKSERKKPLGRPRCRWEDTIKIGREEIKLYVVEWSHVDQKRGR